MFEVNLNAKDLEFLGPSIDLKDVVCGERTNSVKTL